MGNHKVLRTAGSNLRYSMYEFIDAVHKRTIIWERRHANFHNRELRDQAWQQIGQELCKNFSSASDAEKNEIVKTLMKRWKNTRDSYLRVYRMRQSGKDVVVRASYIYEQELSFLLDVKTETEDDEEPLKEETKLSLKRKRLCTQRTARKRRSSEEETITEPLTASNVSSLPNNLHSLLGDLDNSTHPDSIASSAKRPATPFTADSASWTNASAPPSTTDADQAFFDSIKPHMQRMKADQKLDFQIEVLKILRNFKPN
ncbi:uncharacterized protein LOC117586598 [Drosophila guanche]|uniref:MADF domain-containing protein n=1 Tax=Drosophila guanche TaxID=7266 RepID=A0A3B0JSN8_DROGU|nr:uncharacterized protein LOC117586598 [Drosophila guanche]SPP84023.1 Hypothetical predicted protein [Drosophila guanche]